jgi:predicted dehydrogenase
MEERGQRFVDEYGGEYSGDLDAVLGRDDVEGFIICSENTRHLPLLRAAIPVGKPIFCEKPLATTTAETTEALALMREHGTIVHMGYFQPFAGALQGVINQVNSGALGQITHARYRNAHAAALEERFSTPDRIWFSNPELAGGGAFMDMGTHAVHLLRTLLGPVTQVFATISNVSGIYSDVDDNGTALLRFEKGLEITGRDGVLYEDVEQGYVTAVSRNKVVPVAAGEDKPTRIDRLIAAIEGNISAEELEADLRCAVDAVAIMEACYQSNESGTWVDVQDLYGKE